MQVTMPAAILPRHCGICYRLNFCDFKGQGSDVDGGALAMASNLVFQIVPNGRLVAHSADKGEKLLDMPTGQTSGMSAPITYMLDGKQYIAFMGGTGGGGRGGGGGGGGGRGGRGAPPAPQEPTAAAAARGNTTPPAAQAPAVAPAAPAAQAPPATNFPKLYVFTLNPTPAASDG